MTNKGHEGRLHDVYNEALNVNRSKTGLGKLLRDARLVVSDWDAFLRQALLTMCPLPSTDRRD